MGEHNIPTVLASRELRVVRPRDLKHLYVNPSSELTRLVDQGIAQRISRGYFVLVPSQWLGYEDWRPKIEAVGLGIGIADYGVPNVALMGISAARLHGTVPRALAVASIAVPKQRPTIHSAWGHIVFHTRDVNELDLERVDTELASGYQTTAEQTILDLARWPSAWKTSLKMISESIETLAYRADWALVRDLALSQRQPSAYMRARWVAHAVVPDAPILHSREPVNPLGLRPSVYPPDGTFPTLPDHA
jgi:hypothetical protein